MEYYESETVELKAEFVDDIKKEVIAFANKYGGKIYIGIEDDGTVCGVSNADFVIRQISNTLRDSVKPDITMLMGYDIRIIDEKKVIELNVQCGTHKPYYLSAKGLRPEGVYVRQGTSCVPASDLMIRQMIKETDGDNYEDMRSLNQNLTFEKASAEFKRRNLLLEEPQMKALGIIDSEGLFTNLALLLSDQCPYIIKAATFEGKDGLKFHDRTEFTGSLLKQLEDAYAYMKLRSSICSTYDGLLRIDRVAYPESALRESLLNAIVHRDYSISAVTLLSVYTDRMEIISIGGLAGISYDDMMLGVSYCRNKKLAEIFYRLQLIESYGTGIGKIMAAYGECPQKPQLKVTSGAFKIILADINYTAEHGGNNAKSINKNKNETILLELLHKNKKLTRKETENALSISTSAARRILKKLCDDGYIISAGQGKNIVYLPTDIG